MRHGPAPERATSAANRCAAVLLWTLCACGPEAVGESDGAPEGGGDGAASTQVTEASGNPPARSSSVGSIQVLERAEGSWTHDFGSVPAMEASSFVFSFLWNGEGDLTPSALRPNCGCLSAILLASGPAGGIVEHPLGTPLPARRPFAVKVTLDTKGISGALEKLVHLVTDEPPGTLRLGIRAQVQAPD